MKKFIIFIVSIFLTLSFVSALNVSQEEKNNIDIAIDIIEKSFGKKGFEYKLAKMKDINEKIETSMPFFSDSQIKNKLTYLQQQLENRILKLENLGDKQLDSLELKIQSYKGINDSFEYLDSSIDWDKFRKAWLEWQNKERKNLGLTPFILSDKLNRSATIWAEYLSENNLTNGLHKRKSTDGYYEFDSVYSWFKGLGIDFEWIDGAPFTENIGYGYIKCSSNCTDKLIDATKKSFDYFMSEKSYNGAHYRAISHNLFQEIGVSAVVRNNRYYVVIHYGTEVM